MDLRLGISTSICESNCGIRQLKIMEEESVNHFELFSGSPSFDLDNKKLVKEIKRYLGDSNLKCWSVHAVCGERYDFSLFGGREQNSSLLGIKKSIELAYTLKADKVVIHPSGESIFEMERDVRLSQCKEGLEKLVEFAKGSVVKLAIENLPRSCLGNTSQEVLEITSGFALDVVGICMDVNHIFNERIDQFITSVGNKVITTHISDNDGIDEKHWLPMKGVIDWHNLLSALRNINYHGMFMYEVKPKDRTFKEEVRGIKENYKELENKFWHH